MSLCEYVFVREKNYKIFSDNWFTSVPLKVALKEKGIYFVGTVQSNRMSGCPLKPENELKKLEEALLTGVWRHQATLHL